jgi:hypothetical protein
VRGWSGGGPANHGIWSWGDEILVDFSAGTYKDLGPERHAIDRTRPEEHLLGRGRDGGLSWPIENPSEKGALIPVGKALRAIGPPGLKEKPWQDCPGGIDFTHPDFALTLRMTDTSAGPASSSTRLPFRVQQPTLEPPLYLHWIRPRFHRPFAASVDVTSAPNTATQTQLGVADRSAKRALSISGSA